MHLFDGTVHGPHTIPDHYLSTLETLMYPIDGTERSLNTTPDHQARGEHHGDFNAPN